MLFNSHLFIFIFLPIVFAGYFFFASIAPAYVSRTWLAASSLFFYGFWNPSYLFLILISITINFLLGRYLILHKNRLLLSAGVVLNLSLLGYFKYTDFFISNMNLILSKDIPLFHFVLPLAISFFTFQQISYLVDCQKGKVSNYNFINYTLFITFFPHLIAGPIVHHKVMMPQFQSAQNLKINFQHIALGMFIFSIGLFKKVILADHFSTTVIDGMNYLNSITFFDAWTVILSYAFQLYFDFSGYSDMAIGLALLFNIKLPINFNSPYKATNFQELASRWHITLTRFLYEYVYNPMNRWLTKRFFINIKIGTRAKTLINVMLLFLLSGVWHGAGWNFVIWGFLVGLGIGVYRLWRAFSIKLPLILAWGLTFFYFNFSLVFFKISELEQASLLIKAMLGLNGFILPEQLSQLLNPLEIFGVHFESTPLKDKFRALGLIILGFLIVLGFKNTSEKMTTFKPNIIYAFFIVIIFVYSVLHLTKATEFLYFKF
ncbi:MBOAT family O-acyltransferase [Paenibacillus sp. YIM B09110]|uniref:MBOAT family O-acyltransferase n=1 Tax=Paenibacillus sp. YIM B09110 TaxID=3126102 RepID=UPI00301C8528